MKYSIMYDKRTKQLGYITDCENEIPYEDDNYLEIIIQPGIVEAMELTQSMNEFFYKKHLEGYKTFDFAGNITNDYVNVMNSYRLLKEGQLERLAELKQLLQESDYKVIVNYERQMANLQLKYNPIVLNQERQAYRDEINQLELLGGNYEN